MKKVLINFSIIIMYILLIVNISSSSGIDSLLSQYAQKADLSAQTKKESAGFLIVFTRSDLDRMHIKSLSELINFIPFMKYGENDMGLGDVYYSPYQDHIFNPLIVYINDREALSPFDGNGFQIFGQLDMGYIDHIEVYLGLPSYEIGFETAVVVIKVYTKKGYRENAAVLDSMYGTYGTNDTYIYKGGVYKDTSYFAYLDYRNYNRKKIYHKGYKLSRDKDTVNFYGELDRDNLRFETQIAGGNLNDFIGRSWDMTPKFNKTNPITYLYGGLYYTSNDDNWKAYWNYVRIYYNTVEESDGHVGVFSIPKPPYYQAYNYIQFKADEQMSDLSITKKFKSKNNVLLVVIRGRYKNFKYEKLRSEFGDFPDLGYDTEYILSGYAEDRYLIDDKNIIIASLKSDRYIENGGVHDTSTYGGRLGYIYNDSKLSFKTFVFFGGFAPEPFVLFVQNGITNDTIKQQKGLAVTSELKYRFDSSIISLMYTRFYMKDAIFFDLKEYRNNPNTQKADGISLRYSYHFDPLNRVDANIWAYRLDTKQPFDRYQNLFGGYIALFNTFGRFDLYNALFYRHGYPHTKAAYNLNTAINYNMNKNLSLYLKGNNLLNRSIDSYYLKINPITQQKTQLNVQSFDRSIWLGVEYKF